MNTKVKIAACMIVIDYDKFSVGVMPRKNKPDILSLPGGKLDQEDYFENTLPRHIVDMQDPELGAAFVAALREMFEEVGHKVKDLEQVFFSHLGEEISEDGLILFKVYYFYTQRQNTEKVSASIEAEMFFVDAASYLSQTIFGNDIPAFAKAGIAADFATLHNGGEISVFLLVTDQQNDQYVAMSHSNNLPFAKCAGRTALETAVALAEANSIELATKISNDNIRYVGDYLEPYTIRCFEVGWKDPGVSQLAFVATVEGSIAAAPHLRWVEREELLKNHFAWLRQYAAAYTNFVN